MEDKSAEITLFEAIETKLAELHELKTIEIYNAQYDNEDQERARRYPYVTVEISTDWTGTEARNSQQELLQNQQKGACTVTVRLNYDSLLTETKAWKEFKALNHKLFRKLNGLSDANQFTPLERSSTPHEEPHGPVTEILTVWQTTLIEFAITDDDRTEIGSGNWEFEQNMSLDIDNDKIRTGDGE